MKRIRLIPLILIICLVFSTLTPSAFALDNPNINGKAALVVDLETGAVLYELNKDDERAPASLTKVMTILLVMEALDRGELTLDEMITAQSDCRVGMSEDASSSGILPGMSVSVKDLLYCALLQSANESCNIFASRLAGSIEAFVQRMNERAAELGCEHTHFVNTNGLTANDHYSSAYDLYLITKEAVKYPLFTEICNTTSYQADSPAVNNGYPMSNSNALISAGSIYGSHYLYEYASGIKTGHTNAAGYCLISTAAKGKLDLMAIVLGCEGDMNTGEYWNFEDSRTLYDWCFDNFDYRMLVSATEPITRVDVAMAEDGGVAILRPSSDFSVLIPNEIANEDIVRSITVYEDKLTAPIAAGTVLGELRLSANGVMYGTVKLINSTDIALSKSAYIKARLSEIVHNGWFIAIAGIVGGFLLIYLLLVMRYRRLRQKHLRERRKIEQRRQAERQEAFARQQSSARQVRRVEREDAYYGRDGYSGREYNRGEFDGDGYDDLAGDEDYSEDLDATRFFDDSFFK